MGAAEHFPVTGFEAVADDTAVTMRTMGCQSGNGTFETVESHGATGPRDLKGFVVIIAANIAFCHDTPPSIRRPAKMTMRRELKGSKTP
jgi:hypothetical protein